MGVAGETPHGRIKVPSTVRNQASMTEGLCRAGAVVLGALAKAAGEVLEDDGQFLGIDMLGASGGKR